LDEETIRRWRIGSDLSLPGAIGFDTVTRRVYPSGVSDDLFPSGPWTGFYNYQPGDRHRMDLHLSFANGRLSGDGNDDVGQFSIRGRYDAESKECWWTKTYLGSHDVRYRGFREGKGIWGTWEIAVFTRGGFHIWPRAANENEGDSTAASEAKPAEAIAPAMAHSAARPQSAGEGRRPSATSACC